MVRQIAFMTASYRWPPFADALSEDRSLLADVKAYMVAAKGGKRLEDEKIRAGVEALFGKCGGLESFLKSPPGSELLEMGLAEMEQVVFFATLTQEKATARSGRLSREEVLVAVARGQSLAGAELSRLDLRGADLRGAPLEGANLAEADLSGANLEGVILVGAMLESASLRGADMRGADMRWANMRWADLTEANLRQTNLRGADLEGAYLTSANLGLGDLSRANLRWAHVQGAKLGLANLGEADLREADFESALGLTEEQVSKAIYDESTLWPEGFSPKDRAA